MKRGDLPKSFIIISTQRAGVDHRRIAQDLGTLLNLHPEARLVTGVWQGVREVSLLIPFHTNLGVADLLALDNLRARYGQDALLVVVNHAAFLQSVGGVDYVGSIEVTSNVDIEGDHTDLLNGYYLIVAEKRND